MEKFGAEETAQKEAQEAASLHEQQMIELATRKAEQMTAHNDDVQAIADNL